MSGGVPKEWVRVRLDEIAEVRLGRQRSPKNHSGTQMRPYLRAANVDWSGLKLDDVKEMNFTDEELETYRLQKGDIVVGEASGSPHEVGKPAIWNNEILDCCIQNTLIRVRTHGVDPRYLLLFLRSEALRGAFVEKARGVGINHIGAAKLAAWTVPMPPVSEQGRIVAVLDEQLSRLDVAEKLLANVIAMISRFETVNAQSLMSLDRPKSKWGSSRIGDMAKVGSGATPLRSRKDYYDGGCIPWVTSSLVSWNRIQEAEQYVTEKALRETSINLLAPGTLLMAMYGEGGTRGRCAELEIWATTNQACASITLNSDNEHRKAWVKAVLRATYEKNRSLSAGGVQKNLNLGLIRNIVIPLPSGDEQAQILARLDESSRAVARSKQLVKLGLQRSAVLRRTLLTEAFAGRLVPQDPDDEPADALLARIQAERAAAPQRRRGRRAAPAQRAASDPPAPATTPTTPLTGVQTAAFDLEMPSS